MLSMLSIKSRRMEASELLTTWELRRAAYNNSRVCTIVYNTHDKWDRPKICARCWPVREQLCVSLSNPCLFEFYFSLIACCIRISHFPSAVYAPGKVAKRLNTLLPRTYQRFLNSTPFVVIRHWYLVSWFERNVTHVARTEFIRQVNICM